MADVRDFATSPHVAEIGRLIDDANGTADPVAIRSRASSLGQRLSGEHRNALFDRVDAILNARKAST